MKFKLIILFFYTILVLGYTFSIKLSEVYYDWTNEYIWIFNNSNKTYSWNITISWAKSKNITINVKILPKEEIIVWDNIDNFFSWYKAYRTWLWLSISDTKNINIDILSSTWLLDNFYVDWSLVNKFNNKKTSFEKLFFNTWEIIKNVITWTNNKSTYKINPWYVFFKKYNTTNTNTGNKNNIILCKVEVNQNISWYSLYYTWNFQITKLLWYKNWKLIWIWNNISLSLSWFNKIDWVWIWSWFMCTWESIILEKTNIQKQTVIIEKNIYTWTIKITEVNPVNNKFPEYIELKSIWNFSWDVTFLWLWRWETKWTTHITMYSWNYLVISKSLSWFQKSINLVKYSSMSLKDSWETIKIEHNWKTIDSITFSWENTNPTPWFEFDFKNKKSFNCKIIFQSAKEINWKIKINLNSNVSSRNLCSDNFLRIWSYSWWLTTWTCNPWYFYIWTWLQTITFKIKNKDWNILCSDVFHMYNQIKINIKIKKINHTKYTHITPSSCKNMNSYKLNELIKLIKNKYKSNSTLKKIFSPIKKIYVPNSWQYANFFNSRQIRQLVEQTMSKYSKTTLKYIFSPARPLLRGKTYKNIIWKWQIKIVSILPNPIWKDLKEQLILSWSLITWLKMQINNHIYKLLNPELSWNLIIFSWKLHLNNKWWCIKIFNNNHIFDEKCYLWTPEWQIIKNFIKPNNFYNLKNIDFTFSWKNILVYINKNLVKKTINKPLINLTIKMKKWIKIIEKIINKIKKTNKKLNSLYIHQLIQSIKNYNKYIKYKNKYKRLEQDKKNNYKKYKEKILSNKKKINQLKIEIRYLKKFIHSIKSKINKKVYKKYLKLYRQIRQWMTTKSYILDGM